LTQDVASNESQPPPPSQEGRLRLLAGLALGGLLVAAVILFLVGPDAALNALKAGWDLLTAAPAPVYFGVLTLVLMLPIPASLLYVTAGPIYGITASLLWIAPALAINALIVHAIGSTALRPALLSLVESRGRALPTLEERSDQLLFMTLVRVTPGIPYFLQSWAIVLAGVDRLPFLLISVGVQIFYAAGFVILGQSAFEGRLGLAALAVALLIAAGIAARFVHQHLQAKQNARAADASGGATE